MRRTAIALLAAVLLLAFAGGSAAPAQAQDNIAIAINTKDGTDIFKLAFKIVRVNQEIVDQSNAAVAFNSCEQCQSIAIAFQIILIFSDPDVVTSQNVALAINYECSSCVAFAAAYQWVLTTGGPVKFTPEGKKRLGEFRKRLRELLESDLTIEQLQAELDQIKMEVGDILANELVPAGQKDDDETTTEETTTEEPETTTEETTTEGSTTTSP
jgi:putative peptide zinc metalloprotease protein